MRRKRQSGSGKSVKPAPVNLDPYAHPTDIQAELDGERRASNPGRSTGFSLRWVNLFGLRIPVGFRVGLSGGVAIGPGGKKKELDTDGHGRTRTDTDKDKKTHLVWDSELGRFVKPGRG